MCGNMKVGITSIFAKREFENRMPYARTRNIFFGHIAEH